MLRSITSRWEALADRMEALRLGPSVDSSSPPASVAAVRVLILMLVLATVPFASPHPALASVHGIATIVALVICTAAWLFWLRPGNTNAMQAATLTVMAAAGGALAGLSAFSPAVAVGCVVTSSAGVRLSSPASIAITAETIGAFLIAGVAVGAPVGTLAGYPAAFVGLWAFGVTRRAYVLRAQEAEAALEQARRAHAAENQAAALAERARIAREIHDVLAHSLAAVSVNLQAADGLLGSLPEESRGSEVVKAMECIERAVVFTRDGMAETRRAILALREGADEGEAEAAAGGAAEAGGAAAAASATATATDPASTRLVAELRKLTDEHRATGDAEVDFDVAGTPRPVGAEAALTAYRTVQESLTNARKHAPGEPVRVGLTFTADALEVLVVNALPPDSDSAGYGLTGLRERAALAGGTLAADRIAGPDGGQWHVCLRIPV